MNKKSLIIAGLALGCSMAVAGVGVAVSAASGAKGMPSLVKADSTASLVASSLGLGNSNPWTGTTVSPVTFGTAGTGSNPAAYYTTGSGIRLYNGDKFTLSITDDYSITGATFTFSGSGYTFSSSSITADGGSYSESGTTGTLSSVTSRSILIPVSRTCRLQRVDVTYAASTLLKPLTADPVLKIGSEDYTDKTTSLLVGKSFSLIVETTPSDTDESISVTSADSTKVSVTGDSSPYTITGAAATDSPVRITVAGSKGVYSSYIDVEVNEPTQLADDKVFAPASLGLSGTSYTGGNNGDHPCDAVTYSTLNVAEKDGAFQFRANSGGNGKLYNKTAFALNGSNVDIGAITLFMNSSTNNNSIHVYQGTSAEPSSEVSVVGGTVSAKGVNRYEFGSGKSFFKIASTGSNGAIYIDRIVIELADSASTDLASARVAAGKILSGLTGACGTGGTGNVTSAQWADIATDVGSLTDGAKAILKNATRLPIDSLDFASAKIENAMYHYDAVIEKWHYSDILEISNVSVAAVSNAAFNTMVDEKLPLIIIIVCAGAVASVGLFLAQRKRRKEF